MKNYLNKLNFNKLTEVQNKIIKISPNKNVLILSPCGSGKTEAVYNWLLIQGRKTLFIQPMRTLATSIYNRLNEYNKKLRLEKWSIQHSNIPEDKFLNNKYCVTTIDQVLTGWMGLGKQSFIRGKNIITSDLIFDEIQLFEIDKTFQTTLNMLDSIYRQDSNNFVIMTATMPEYLIEFLKKRYNMEVVVCEEESVKNRYININYIGNIDFEKINNCKEKQIIICNSQSQQKQVLDSISDINKCIILNNKLLKTDREHVEKEVYKYFGKSSKQNDKILITTQIVEAGIDISSNIVYSVSAPIDNLIQRAGRCSRWGGSGVFYVFDLKNYIYNKDIIKDTINKIKNNNKILFSWKIQKQWLNEILNPYYKKYINNNNIKRNKAKLLNNKRNELIRDIRNVNVIVQDTKYGISLDMFSKESVSIDKFKLKQLKNNEFYILEKGCIKSVNYYDIDIGDTIVISNESCIYDKLGFRIEEGCHCESFKYENNIKDKKIEFRDYIKEKWISHTLLTKECMIKNLNKYRYIKYINDNFKLICKICGLHDLGKLDIEWVKWAGDLDTPLAHFPFTRKIFKHKNRKHNYISAYILKQYIDKILFNVIIQHHGRVMCIDKNLYIDKYKLHSKYKEILNTYRFEKSLINIGEGIKISGDEVMNPSDKNWNIFLIIVGTLMESDIKAINTYLDNNLLNT